MDEISTKKKSTQSIFMRKASSCIFILAKFCLRNLKLLSIIWIDRELGHFLRREKNDDFQLRLPKIVTWHRLSKWWVTNSWIQIKILKVALGVSSQFFSIWTRVLNHNKYVEIKQFSKVDIKQNNISTVILLIKFLVYQWDPRHLQRSQVVYIFIYTLYSCSI